MPLTRLDNLYSSKTGKYLYVSPDDFNATDELDNRGNSPLRPFKTIQRAFIEVSRYSYLPGKDNDRFDQFSVMLMPGNHYIDNRPGLVDAANPELRFFDAANLIDANKQAIVDRAAADIATNHPDFYYPNDQQTQDYSRFKDAFRLLQLNRQEIINTSWDNTLAQYPAHGDYETKCKRDLGLFIDSLGLDVAQADGNVYTRKFCQTFFNEAGSQWLGGTLDGEQDEAKYAFEQARDQMFLAISNQLSAQDLTITADNAPGSDYGSVQQQWTPSNAWYTPSDGKLKLEISSHGLSIGDHINIAAGGLKFSCDQDNNTSQHDYPRVNDPAAGKYLRIDEVATDTITVNVGQTQIVNYDPTNATYNPTTGDLSLTIGVHNLGVGETVKLATNSLSFKCGMDGNYSTHTYPRVGDPAFDTALQITNVGSTYTASGGTSYNPVTGVLTVNIDNHGFTDGDQVKLADGAVTFTCDKDSHTTNHAYPRATDPSSGNWLAISNVTTNTFDVQVGVSPEVPYNVSAATYVPTTGMLTLEIGQHNFSGETNKTVTTASYTPSTGIIELTIPDHNYIDGDRIKIVDGSLTFTCDQDRHNSEHAYPRVTDPFSNKWLPVSNLTNDTVEVNVGATPTVNYTPTAATYDPANGNLVLTIGTHTLDEGTTLKIADGSLTFTCDMDGHATEHTYPRSTDPAYNKPVTIVSVGATQHQVTAASYEPTTGKLTLVVPGNTFVNGERILLENDSLTFTCAKDNNATNHTYPRATDDASGQWLEIADHNPSADSFSVNVGISPDISVHQFVESTSTALHHQDGTITLNVGISGIVNYDVSAANYTPSTGEMVLTLSQPHTIKQGQSIKLKEEGLTFTCANDNDQTQHKYPRATIDNHTADTTGTSYDPNTGILTIQTTAAHGMRNGDWVKFAQDSLSFTCAMDSNGATKTYPRTTDPTYDQWLQVSNVTTNSFTVEVGSSPIVSHNVTDATYNQATGEMVLTIGEHNLKANTSIRLEDNSLTFTCDKDNNQTNHTYPRNDGTHDTIASNTAINIESVTSTTITILVGFAGSGDQYPHTFVSATAGAVRSGGGYIHTCTAGAADGIYQKRDRSFDTSVTVSDVASTSHQPEAGTGYTPSTGLLRVKITNHGFASGDRVKFKDNGLTFTCNKDLHQTDHTYPRATDPVSGDWLEISNVTTDEFDVNIGTSYNTSAHIFKSADADALEHQSGQITINVGIASDLSAHTFVTTGGSGTDAVITGGSYAHQFVSATADAIVTGGNYTHTFVSAAPNGVIKAGDSIKIGANTLRFTCAYNGHSSQHSYPRTSDPAYNSLLPIVSATATSITVDVGISPDTSQHIFIGAETGAVSSGGAYDHSFVSAVPDSITRQDGTVTVNVGTTPIVNFDVTAATYEPTTGVMQLNIGANHGLTSGQSIKLAEESLEFTCDTGSGPTAYSYPRSTIDNHTATTGTTYDPNTGILSIVTTAAHGMRDGDWVKLDDGAISFTCLEDGGSVAHAYPRATDPISGMWIPVTRVDDTTFTVDVLQGTTPTNVTAHTYDSAVADAIKQKRDKSWDSAITIDGHDDVNGTITINVGISSNTAAHTYTGGTATGAVITGGNYTHEFVSAVAGALITGGNYGHLFVSSLDNSVTYAANVNNRANSSLCSDIQSFISNLTAIVTQTITDGDLLTNFPAEAVSGNIPAGEEKCKRDIGYFVDAVVADLRNGGNSNIISTTKTYFDRDGNPLADAIVGEVAESVTAFNGARDQMTKAVSNQLYSKDLEVTQGPAIAGQNTLDIDYGLSGNAQACSDVQSNIVTLTNIMTSTLTAGTLNSLASVQVTGTVPIFDYNQALEEWQDDSIIDLSNPDNVLYKFNASEGGVIVPRGCSLIGYDLRRTIVRPLYVPDCVDGDVPRTGIFRLTGGCYLWQMTIKDGDLSANSPLFDQADNVGKVYNKHNDFTSLAVPEYSHHKITIMSYADNDDLDVYYQKVGRAFAQFQPTIDDGELEARVQENRIVGPLSDTRTIESIKTTAINGGAGTELEVTTKIDHGYFVGQYVATLNSGLSTEINGTWKVQSISPTNPKVFTYEIPINPSGLGLVDGATYTTANGLGTGAVIQAEIDSVESASPYVFNCSIRSTWGYCGMWADGSKTTGFKSMVVAQYTGVTLQKDDRAFIRYDRFNNTWNQASLTDSFATIPYHTKGDAYWKDDWRNWHIKASDDAFIQCVSVFAVGYHDHFLMESGGDMSITNSNSNFGNTSLHAKGFKGYAFNQDKGGYIDAIVPPKVVDSSAAAIKKNQYYTIDIETSNDQTNHTRLYIAGDANVDPGKRPAATLGGYRIGAKNGEQIFVKLPTGGVGGKATYHATLEPTGFTTYSASLSTLTPSAFNINFDLDNDGTNDFNLAQDAATLLEKNRQYIATETYGYITNKYPALLTNPALTITKCERDIGYFVDAAIKDLRVGGNINTINTAQSYFVGSNLNYVTNELVETLEAYDYAKKLMISTMRNFTLLVQNCTTTANSSTVVVGDTSGLLPGMSVTEYASTDFTDGWIDTNSATQVLSNIDSSTIVIDTVVNATTITLKDATTGLAYECVGGTTTAWLYFEYQTRYASPNRFTDNTITISADYPECTSIASALQGYYDTANLILSGNSSSITRVEPIIESSSLSGRATVFTINTGGGQSDPHGWQTGTPVRLVPSANQTFGSLDKRLIRLPLGFNPNQTYYVIAPGRDTYPFSFNGNSDFDNTAVTKLMLASSKENAAAGIYIFSPETDFIDPSVEIKIQQYVIDDVYDLHRYVSNVSGTYIESEVPHLFDIALANVDAQKVFFGVSADATSALPIVSSSPSGYTGTVQTDVYYYPRFETKTKFSIHETQADAQAGTNAVIFQAGSGKDFLVYGDKKTSPLKYDASTFQRWYLNVKPDSVGGADPDNILTRFHAADFLDGTGNLFTPDTWFERIDDQRSADDRIFRLRYVVPQYLQNVREPLNGYVIKTRTDDRRRLTPQKFWLEPLSGSGAPDVAQFYNPAQPTEQLGINLTDLNTAGIDVDNRDNLYDPYKEPLVIEFTSLFKTTVQSARIVDNGLGDDRLELTTFDHNVDNTALKNKQFHVLQIGQPQGAGIQANLLNNTTDNYVTWSGASTGSAYVHAYFTADIEATEFVILKDVEGTLSHDPQVQTTFTQSNGTFWNSSSQPDSWGLQDVTKSRSSKKDYLYRMSGANTYTLCPGDTITTPTGHTYKISMMTDVPEVEDTFYIFDSETIQDVIPGQQDGIYYLTAIRGNISPYPTGAGVGNNFQNYKFSQPVSSLYPFNYKNDPLWFQVKADGSRDTTIIDPPSSVAAANNYVHGYVTLNDNKNSETKEAIVDLLATDPLLGYSFTNTTAHYETGAILDNRIQAQIGNASIGSENRQIPINGDSQFPLDDRLYVELRRPSIARSGNHTFEYLGFGPGNYSTGFPLRQEVVLSDKQDFYAQAKREDAGIVFYTGLNSNGDLYIGNRKINAITGEETFLEQAALQETEDDTDSIGALVTTFDTAVTFNDKITVEGDTYLNNPVTINVDPLDGDALRVYSLVGVNDDPTLDRSSFRDNKEGDVTITKNEVQSGVFTLNPRGNIGDPGQPYTIRTHYTGGLPANASPNQTGLVANGGSAFYTLQNITYGSSNLPNAGDILVKGKEVGKSGSLGWIFSNYYTEIADSQILKLTSDNSTKIVIEWASGITNDSLNIKAGEFLRISNFSDSFFNGTWEISSSNFVGSASTCEIYIYNQIAANDYAWSSEGPGAKIEVSLSNWKEVGVLGAEALRTLTEVPGDLRLGINTIGRMAIEGAIDASVSPETDPRANLDVVGTAFISGKSLVTYDNQGAVTTNNYLSEPSTAKVYFSQDNAFLVGGDSSDPNDYATFRVATSDAPTATFTVTTGGSGYTPGVTTGVATTASVLSGGDNNLTVDITVNSNGVVESAVVNNPGSGYKAGDLLNVTGSGAGDTVLTIVTYRSSTYQTGGRVAINGGVGLVTDKDLDRNLVVVGDSRFTGNVKIHDDLSVDGGDINSTAETFQFINTDTDFFIGLANTESIILANTTTQTQTISIGNSVANNASHIFRMGGNAGTTTLEIHKRSDNAIVDIATVTDLVSSNADIKIGGAAPNLDSQTYIGTFQTKLAGTLEVGAFAGTSSTRIFSNAGHVDLIDGQNTNTLTLGRNASNIEIASLGGKTYVRNTLEVLASAIVNSHIKLVGGLQAGIIEIERGQFSAGTCNHIVGSLENPNIDFLKYIEVGKSIDTAGVGQWGGEGYLLAGGQIAAIDGISPTQSGTWVSGTYSFLEPTGGSGGGALFTITIDAQGNNTIELVTPGSGYSNNDLLTITGAQLGNPSGDDLTFSVNGVNAAGNLYNLPITQPSINDFKIGDLILIERGHVNSPDDDGQGTTGLRNHDFNEIVEVAGLTNITNANDPLGYRLAVIRAKDGTTQRTDHPDNCVVAKLDKQPNASYITGFDFDLDGEIDPVSEVLVIDNDIQKIVADGTDIVTIHWQSKTNTDLSVDYGEFIRISSTNVPELNGDWPVQSTVQGAQSTVEIKIGGNLGTNEYLWSAQASAAEIKVTSSSGLLSDTANVRIGVAEFGGILTTSDYLRLSDCEIVRVVELTTTEIQSLIINDGGTPENITFKVESTTGNTFGQGDLNFGQGFNKLVVDGITGNTAIAGTLTTENTLTVNGSVVENTEFFRLTNGGATGIPLRTTLEVDTATGDLTINGGDINIFGEDGTTPRLSFNNSSGDFTTYGSFSALGSGTSRFGGGIQIGGAHGTTDTSFPYNAEADLTINGGDLTINHAGNKVFSVENDGAVNIAGIDNYFSQTGGRKWEYKSEDQIQGVANVNYFLNISQNTVFKLPANPLIGDMIRIIDIGGLLTYNMSLVVRAPTNTKVQNSTDNTGGAMLTGNPAGGATALPDIGYNGGEMIVQTPYAGFALVYAGVSDPDGNTAAPAGKNGWYLIEV